MGKARRNAAEATRLADLGCEHHRAERLAEAEAAFREALRYDADNVDALMNLGVLLCHQGAQVEGPKHVRRALEVAPKIPALLVNAANVLAELGLWAEATRAIERALMLRPPPELAALAYETLGFILLENGRRAEAVPALERAIAIDSTAAAPYFRLHAALYDDHDLAPAKAALSDAVARNPDDPWYRICLGMILDQTGDTNAANQQFARVTRDGSFRGTRTSWEYVKRVKTRGTRFFPTTSETLRHGLDQARPDGLVLEFGVRFGISTRWIAAHGPGEVHGFDSFQGLPEAWHTQSSGTYTTRGERPPLPPNAKLHVGLFDATLPSFLAQHPGPIRFMNVDCDLYSSTKVVFDLVGERIGPGTVIAFDEYVMNERWAEDEYKAFQEAVAARGWRYEYLAFSVLNSQAVVRILG
jgi:Tfp pilus assembly protein PilF/predicted O-methyltransferase YrrM